MKQLILLVACLTSLLLSAQLPLRAQIAPRDSDARSRSRLEIGRTSTARKTAMPVSPSRVSLFLAKPTNGLDRSLTYSKQSPINAYYRSLLLNLGSPKTPVRQAVSENAIVVAPASRPATEELRNERVEDRMYADERIIVSNIYPNPASEAAEVDYQLLANVGEAKLILLNVLGAPVAEYDLERNDRKVRINTRDFSTGWYFYQLSLDGKKVATKKLLVRHQ
jgi:Secretion system C-terminal sorting domain